MTGLAREAAWLLRTTGKQQSSNAARSLQTGRSSMLSRWVCQMLSRLLPSFEPPPPPRRYFSRRSFQRRRVMNLETQGERQRSYPAAAQGPLYRLRGAAIPGVSTPEARTSVLCCIDGTSASSISALEFAARMACKRRNTADVDVVVVLVHPSSFFATVDAALELERPGESADVRAMVEDVSAHFGLTMRVDEVWGWSQPDIARIVRERGSDAVILPILDDDVGHLVRWRRRDLVSGLIDRTHAVVVDEYDRPFVGDP
jgi:hypothetical protein